MIEGMDLTKVAESVPALFVVYLIIKEMVAFGKGKNGKKEVEIAVIKEKLDKIENNHLKHINDKLDVNEKEHTEIKVMVARVETKIDDLKR